MTEQIKVKQIDYKNATILSGLDDLIMLDDNYLEYKWSVHVGITEEGDIKKEKYQGQKFLLKRHIAGVDCFWSNQHERWITSPIVAHGESPCWIFETLKEALEVKDKIAAWLLT